MPASNYSDQTHLQFHCLPHSTGVSPSSYVTIAIRSLHCNHLPVKHYRNSSDENNDNDNDNDSNYNCNSLDDSLRDEKKYDGHENGVPPPSDLHLRRLYTSNPLLHHHNQQQQQHQQQSDARNTKEDSLEEEYSRYGTRYRIQVTLTGTGGLPLHSSPVGTAASTVLQPSSFTTSMSPNGSDGNASNRSRGRRHPSFERGREAVGAIPPSVNSVYSCTWDDVTAGRTDINNNSNNNSNNTNNRHNDNGNVLVLPVRYRDIPRDASFSIQIFQCGGLTTSTTTTTTTTNTTHDVGSNNCPLATVRYPLWDDGRGTLNMGLRKIDIDIDQKTNANDHTIMGGEDVEEDEKWTASLILDQLNQMKLESDKKSSNLQQQQQQQQQQQNLDIKKNSSRHSPSTNNAYNQTNNNHNNRTKGFDPVVDMEQKSQLSREAVPWLDAMTADYCTNILREDEGTDVNGTTTTTTTTTLSPPSETPDSDKNHNVMTYYTNRILPSRTYEILRSSRRNALSLVVEFPTCEFPIVHQETFYSCGLHGASGSVTALDLSSYHHERERRRRGGTAVSGRGERFPSVPMPNPLRRRTRPVPGNGGDPAATSEEEDETEMGIGLVQLLDHESEEDNPVEDKYRTLQHELLRGLVDPALKPDAKERIHLNAIIGGTSQHLSREEKDLLWRFRFSLVDNRRALTKFLLAVEWTVESEVVQAAELLEQWRKRSPIEVADALKLLGKNVAFQTSLVRTYAIDTLAAAPDGELVLYLLPLVQALKYENENGDNTSVSNSIQRKNTRTTSSEFSKSNQHSTSPLGTFLIERAVKNIELANYLYWYLKVELDDPVYGPKYFEVFAAFKDRLSATSFGAQKGTKGGDNSNSSFTAVFDSVSKLGSSLTEAATGRSHALSKSSGQRSMWNILSAQDRFISGVMECQKESREMRAKKDGKEQHLREILKTKSFQTINNGWAVPLPSAPHIMVTGTKPETARMFKSGLYPALIEFYVENSKQLEKDVDRKTTDTTRTSKSKNISDQQVYKVIVKTGDDLRQDQLVIMLIKLMDRILKRGTLDLSLKPYPIMATSQTSGLVEFVEGSIPISAVLKSYNNSILQFFQNVAPCEGAKYGVNQDVMQRYIRSCAGYCVLTYIIGVGDRHLDNIMLQPSGHFFHIDFGFIFGRDPKISVTTFRLTREMIDGMGGQDSVEYKQFCSLCCQAFNLLRKRAGLVLNLLHLMSDAGIEDLSNNPMADAVGVISKVEERFRLELTDEQAETYFLGLINESLAALAPRVLEVFHQIAVARR